MLNARALIAEFIGTFTLIFVGVLVVYHLGNAEAGLIGIALAHGLAIACLASATAAISGGHLNPAVSFGLYLARKINISTMLGYWAAQLSGAILGALLVMPIVVGDGKMIVAHGTPALGHGVTMWGGFLAELIATFLLMFVIYGTAVDHRAPKVGALFIGLTVTLDIFAIGPSTGAAMNPARWFGPAVVSGDLSGAVLYTFGPLLGAALAAILYATMLEDKPTLAPTDPARIDAQ
jgi:aquaporin TIP